MAALNDKSETRNLGVNRRSEDSFGSREHTSSSDYSDYQNRHKFKLSDAKLANFKSPVFLKLESMIETIGTFQGEMKGTRVPVWEQTF